MAEQHTNPDMLYIAAKPPLPGTAKTRLGTAIGHQHAARLYAAFLADLRSRFDAGGLPFGVGWYVAPPSAALEPVLGPAAYLLLQGDGDWTARQRRLFAGAAARGEQRTVLVASDSPQLSIAAATAAFCRLEQHDVVFGPTTDGGYYLVGMRGRHDIFGTIPMSTPTVLNDLLGHIRRSGLSAGLVETLFDVDEAADLDALELVVQQRSDLPATRAALAALRLSQRAGQVANMEQRV